MSRSASSSPQLVLARILVTQRPAEIDATIISQCSTLFVMRLSNDNDQTLIRSAVSDAAANLLSFIPSLGTREVFTFGSGVALPTRMRFKELPAAMRPNSEASGNTRSDAGANISRDLVSTVIERLRSATMSHRMADDEFGDYASPLDAPALQPPMPQAPSYQPPPPAPAAQPGALRSSLLKKPLDANSLGSAPGGSPGLPPRFR